MKRGEHRTVLAPLSFCVRVTSQNSPAPKVLEYGFIRYVRVYETGWFATRSGEPHVDHPGSFAEIREINAHSRIFSSGLPFDHDEGNYGGVDEAEKDCPEKESRKST